MPCADGGPSRAEVEDLQHKRRGPVVGLCIACAKLTELGALPDELRAWYAAHLEADAASDAFVVARDAYTAAARAAKSLGYTDLAMNHPARVAYDEVSRRDQSARFREEQEARNLSRLKPAPSDRYPRY